MINQVEDSRVTETGGSTAGDTFMFLIKVPLSLRRDRWRQLRYKLTGEISHPPHTSLYIPVLLPYALSFVCARAMCACLLFSRNIQKKTEAQTY